MGSNKTCFILIIEDNPLDADLVRERLRSSGMEFEAVVADSRAAFEEAWKRGGYDLVLADYSLPDFDGLSALKIVRQDEPRLPFVFVSGVLGEDVAVETLLRGATDYVLKQKMERLIPAVRRALTEYEAYQLSEKAELNLRKVEERFEKLTNSLPAMVWTCDAEGRLTYVNSLWKLEVGEDAKFWCDEAVLHPNDRSACRRAWERARRESEPFEVDCRFRMKDGGYHWHIVRATPLDCEDGQKEWVGTCTDIEQQRVRDAEMKTAERLALTGRMASVIAHEINNPLEALTNILYLVRADATSPEEAKAYLADAQHELLRISAITKQTLVWSREEGKVVDTRVDMLAEEALRLFAGKIKNKGIKLQTQMSDNAVVRVIPGEIRQVLANLISNAVDAVEVNGTIRIQVHCDEASPHVELSVEDDGKGIEQHQLQEIFRPFHSTKGNLGNGLGLYVSKNIIDRHNGDLRISSKPQAGTKVTILLPRPEHEPVLAGKESR